MIYSNNNLKRLIDRKLKDLIKDLDSLDISSFGSGLFSGTAGLSLFYFYAGRYYRDETLYNTGYDLLEASISNCSGEFLTYCDGLAGVNWTVNHLTNYNFIETDLDHILSDSDELLLISLDDDITSNNIDFLHGAVGKGFYFTERGTKDSIAGAARIIDHLYSSADRSISECFFWNSPNYQTNEDIQDLSLAHGLSSIMMFAVRTYLLNINTAKSLEIINKSVNFLISKSKENYISKFPSYADNSGKFFESRLAWCYGDLGIAMTIYRVGNALNNKEYIKLSNDIFLHSSTRRDLKNTRISDSLICHGATGVFLIYSRIFYETMDVEMLHTAEFWLQESINLPAFDKHLNGTENFDNDIGILLGRSGIGLTYLMYLNGGSLTWDRSLLLQ